MLLYPLLNKFIESIAFDGRGDNLQIAFRVSEESDFTFLSQSNV